jgi:PAS domain S-box-containing protein
MAKDFRKTGIDIVGEAPWGTHICQFYRTKDDLIEILVPYFKVGLENNELCIWVTSEPLEEEEAKEALYGAVPDFDRYLERGQMLITPHRGWIHKEGNFDADRLLFARLDELKLALAKGYDGVRVTGNTAWLKKEHWRNFAAYEVIVNNVMGSNKIMAICTYSLDKCRAFELIEAANNHQFALIKREGRWELLESSERKKGIEELNETEERYRLLAENVRDIIWTMDLDLTFTFVSPSVEHMTGYCVDEVMATKIENFLTPASFETAMKTLADALAIDDLKQNDPSGSRTLEVDIYHKDGSLVRAEVRVNFLRDREGEPIGILGVARDISDRKGAEKALIESEERYRSLFEKSPTSITLVDTSGAVINCNTSTEKLTGYSKEEIVGRPFEKLATLDPKDLANLKERFMKLCKGEEVTPYELEIISKGGVRRWIRVINSLLTKDKEIVAIQVISEDITKRKKIEESLRESEEKYRNLVERANDGVVIIQDKLVKFINRRGAELIGYEVKELIGSTFANYVYKGELPKLMDLYRRRMSGEVVDIYETKLIHKDGHIVYVEINGGVIRYEGKPSDLAMIRDVTERKLAEEALKESEEKFRNLAEKSPNMIFINKRGKIVYANEKCEEVMGYTRKEFYSPDFNFLSVIAPESRALVKSSFTDHMKGEEISPYEYSLITKDGKRIDSILTTKLIKYGGESAILGIVTDITERKQAEDALRESEAKYSAVVENSRDSIIIIQDGMLKFVNNSSLELMGFTSEEMIGEYFLKFVAEHYRKTVRKRYEDRMAGKEVPNMYEIVLIKKDGTAFPVELNACLVEYEGKPADLVIIRDITERKRTEEQLIQSAKLAEIGTLASGIAHEINNPLAVILGYAEVISEEEDPEKVKKFAKEIVKNTERASNIVKWLSRYSRGSKDSALTDVNLNEVIDTSLEAVQHSRKCEIDIVKKFQKIPPIKGNLDELQQVFINLLNNAIDAVQSGGSISLSTNIENGLVKVKISDNGTGIPKEDINRIFDPFFTRKDVGKGSGLGLYVSSMIVKKHYGDIDVESEMGRGTTFTLKFPREREGTIIYQCE